MIEKAIYKKLLAHLKKIEENEEEHMAKAQSLLAHVPLDVGPSITMFLRYERISPRKIEDVIRYLAEKGIIVPHPWGGYMLPQKEDAKPIPPVEEKSG